MRIKGYIGDKRYETKLNNSPSSSNGLGDITYENKQLVSYFYTLINQSPQGGALSCPEKQKYNELKDNYGKNGLILMNYTNDDSDDGMSEAAYGMTTVPNENYISGVSIYKKEIWYKPNPTGTPTSDAYGNPIPAVTPVEEPIWHLVTNKTNGDTIYDFNVGNNRYYKYLYRFAYAGDDSTGITEGLKEIIVPIKVKWNGWSLTELHEVDGSDGTVYHASLKDVWKFKYNLTPGDFTQNLAKTSQETLAQFPRFSHGPKNNITSNVNCLLGRDVEPFDWTTLNYKYELNKNEEEPPEWEWKWNGSYCGPGYNAGGYKEELWPNVEYSNLTSNKQLDMLNHWRDFCFSGNPKLLRDNQGNRFIVHVHDATSHVEETWQGRPISISFNWTQIKNANDVVILEEI